MAKTPIPYHYFLCEIILKKRNFLGITISQITIVISLEMKIIILKIDGLSIKNFPFKKSDTLNFTILKNWSVENNYTIDFFTKSKKLKLLVNYNLDTTIQKKTETSILNKLKEIFNKVIVFIKR